jgi:hypothetical protein
MKQLSDEQQADPSLMTKIFPANPTSPVLFRRTKPLYRLWSYATLWRRAAMEAPEEAAFRVVTPMGRKSLRLVFGSNGK